MQVGKLFRLEGRELLSLLRCVEASCTYTDAGQSIKEVDAAQELQFWTPDSSLERLAGMRSMQLLKALAQQKGIVSARPGCQGGQAQAAGAAAALYT